MAKKDNQRWWDWRVSPVSGRSIRSDDKRGLRREGKKERQKGRGWWWTMLGKDAPCRNCQRELSPPQKVAYHHPTRKVYCPDCAQEERVAAQCKLSKRLQEPMEESPVGDGVT